MKKKPEIEQISAVDGQTEKKRPYTPPVIIYRELLESTAAACSPSDPGKATSGLCTVAGS